MIPVIIITESVAFWLLANWAIKARTGIWRIVLVVSLGNFVTSLLGTVFPLYKDLSDNLWLVGEAFVLSLLVEWLLYIPFFRAKMKVLHLLAISFVANTVTYAVIAYPVARRLI